MPLSRRGAQQSGYGFSPRGRGERVHCGAVGQREQKYAIDLEQMSPHGAAAAQAAETSRARTVVYSDKTPVAAIVPFSDLNKLEPAEPTEGGMDPLLSLCGSCRQDVFVDGILGDFGKTMLFHRH